MGRHTVKTGFSYIHTRRQTFNNAGIYPNVGLSRNNGNTPLATIGPATTGSTAVSVAGHVPASGATRYYQVWYRDPLPFCTPATYNLTNGVGIVWLP